MKNFYFLITLITLTACSCNSGNNLEERIFEHENRLQMHFLGVSQNDDISSLIKETREIANQLREQNKIAYARKFDSYTDVLMFGNNTLSESLNDVKKLVTQGSVSSKCSCKTASFCELKNKLMKRFRFD